MSMYVYDWSGSACLTDYARISQTRPLLQLVSAHFQVHTSVQMGI